METIILLPQGSSTSQAGRGTALVGAEEAQRTRGGRRSVWLHTEDTAGGKERVLVKDVCEAMLGGEDACPGFLGPWVLGRAIWSGWDDLTHPVAVSVRCICTLSTGPAVGPLPASLVAGFLRSAMMQEEQISSVRSMSISVAGPCSPWCQQVNNSDTGSWRPRFRQESSALRSGAQQSCSPRKNAQPPASREARRPQRGPAALRRPSAPAPSAHGRARPGWGGGSSMLRFPFPVSASEI